MSSRIVKRIVVVGGGTAGWMTAAALSAKLGRSVSIRLIESDAIGTVGVGEATIPHIRHFNATLGIDEADFMTRTNATFKLGIEFRNWGRKGDSYIHPFGAYGSPINGVAFHQHWLRLKQAGPVAPIEAFSVPIQAARLDRFGYPDPDPASLLSTFSYAYQFDAALYARYLREFSEARGVVRSEGRVIDTAIDSASGFVRSVRMENGEEVAGDLFVDCSGFRGLLIEQALGSGYDEWTRWLPCDRAVAVPCAAAAPPSPYTRATALEAGWAWRIPLQHRVGNGYVYASAFMDDDAALAALLARLEGEPIAAPNRLRFVTGRRRRQWVGNVVAIGLSAGFLEPLESTSIHLIQLAIGRLLDLMPGSEWDPLDAAEFDRLMTLEYERVRDFLILHYCATERDDTPFWNHVRTMELPDSLATRITLFRERGAVRTYRDGTFMEPSWLSVLIGQHVLPHNVDPLALGVDADAASATVSQMAMEYRRAAESMPVHADMLAAMRGTA